MPARLISPQECCDTVLIRDIAQAVDHGAVIAFPTETVYGLGTSRAMTDSMRRIYTMKSREKDKPFADYVVSQSHVEKLDVDVPEGARALMDAFWPGPLTLLFLAHNGEKKGVRCPDNHALALLLAEMEHTFCGTSANRSGEKPCTNATDVVRLFGDQVDFVLDGGACASAKPSTILDLTIDPYAIIRSGQQVEEIRNYLRKQGVFFSE